MPATEITKVLIANRGEIAVRIMRTCREIGIRTVAVYSEADRDALHTRYADEAFFIGPSPARESYLVQSRIIDVARQCGADAIHPGYGFLAENAVFADAVAAAGLTFIGPPAGAISAMGDKTEARARMVAAGVPVVPGSEKPLRDHREAEKIAKQISFPVVLKAAAGGGGKGMRVVPDSRGLGKAFAAASSEAESAFGDGRVYLEKYLEKPRHVEFQILADVHGNVVHLGERECSIQRRHQKLVEESPSPILDPALRHKMGDAAVLAVKACGYQNAGTVEFLLDAAYDFYFLEMNTRLQVEHPVTEMVTGLDLVREQMRLAQGERLGYEQMDLQFRGHAIECRINAEDTFNDFMPSSGRIELMEFPSGPGVRVDSGFDQGMEVSLFYDSLLAKLIVWAETRARAIARMRRALQEFRLIGVESSIPFCYTVMNNEDFGSGDFDTHFISHTFPEGFKPAVPTQFLEASVVAAGLFKAGDRQMFNGKTNRDAVKHGSLWKTRGRTSNRPK